MYPLTCTFCNATYNSERELRDHRRMVHRELGEEQRSSQLDGARVQAVNSFSNPVGDDQEFDRLLRLASTFQKSRMS